MLAVLTSTLVAVVGIGDILNNRHYDLVAQEMVDSGVAHIMACDNLLDGNWSVGSYSIKPNTDCSGAVQTGVPEYVTSNDNIRATYSVDIIVTASSGITIISIKSQGLVDLVRTSTDIAWRSYTRNTQLFYQPTTITDISLARTHSCSLVDNKSVYCTGDNKSGQLGIGSTQDVATPTEPFLLPDGLAAIKVVTNEQQTCVLASDGQAYCSGQNTYGQLGDGTKTNRSTPVRFQIPSNRKITDIQIAGNLYGPGDLDTDTSVPYTCALTVLSDGTSAQVYCAGANQYGQLGNATTVDQVTPVKFILPSGTAASFSVGQSSLSAGTDQHSHTCVVTNTSLVYCAGRGLEGQLGQGVDANASTPVRFGASLTDAATVAVSFRGTCVIRSTGALVCAGQNRFGRFGNGTGSDTTYNQPTASFTSGISGNATAMETGPNQMCILTSVSKVYCSGIGAYGRLGNNSSDISLTPVQFATAGTSTTISAVSIGDIQTCVLTTSSKDVYCAGWNQNGQLGLGYFSPTQSSDNPIVVQGKFILPDGVDGAKIATGPRSTCVLTTLGKGYCAGENTYGQLGNNVSSNQSTPIRALLVNPAPLYY